MAKSIKEKKISASAEKKLEDALESPKLCIIGIGASAGGLEALQDFFSHLPLLDNTSVVVAQHLSPTHKSMLVQLLSRQTKLEVTEAFHGKKLEANKIYITPPDKDISIVKEHIYLSKPSAPFGPKPSVDVLFKSLAENVNANLIGIILSGTGSDGALGIEALKNIGAFTMAQEPETAKYDGMPQAAILTGCIDTITAADKMGAEIANYLEHPESINFSRKPNSEETSVLEKIFQLLSSKTGTDFSNYKSATIFRRLEKRIGQLKLKSIEEYLQVIEQNPKEADEMFNLILIGVTTFFRDIESFKALKENLKKLIATKKYGDSIRIWVPGCSTGEEPYSIAIMLSQILKDKLRHYKIQIFGTDIDERAIQSARRGIYASSSLESVSEDIKEGFFIKKGKEFELIKSIKTMVLFSKHDLTRNPPFLKLDLISCRNLLIYFNASLQQHVIPIFHYSLLPEAYLFLGKSESVSSFTDLFGAIDAKNKIYVRKKGSNLHSIKFSAFKVQQTYNLETKPNTNHSKTLSVGELVKETLYNTFEHPYVVVDEQLDIQEIHGDVRLFITLNSGVMQINLIKMVNQEIQIELRTLLAKVVKQKENLKSEIKRFELFNNYYYVRIHARPLIFNNAAGNLYLVIFEKLDINEFIAKGPVESSEELVNEKITELEHELTATKEHLQTYIEEIETSNEELQSLNEELQSTNEELQSSNEELETSNEELQSTNEEIQITYAELKAVNEELEKKEKMLNQVQANSLALLNIELHGLLLIDTSYKIIQFNYQASQIFKKLSRSSLKLADSMIDLFPRNHLQEFIDDFAVAANGENFYSERMFNTNEGESCWFEVNYIPIIQENKSIKAVALAFNDVTDKHILNESVQRAENLLKENELLMIEAQKVAKMGSWNLDLKSNKLSWSQPLYDVFDVDHEHFKESHDSFLSLVDEKDKAFVEATNFKAKETGQSFNITYKITTPKGEKRVIEEFGFCEKDEKGNIIRLFGTAQNITDRSKKEEMLRLFENVIKHSKDAVNISKTSKQSDVSPIAIYINKAFAHLFGYTQEEIIGTDNTQFFGPKSDQTELFKLSEGFKNHVPVESTIICYKKSGETFWNNISCSPVLSNDGEPIYWISIQRDVTEIQTKIKQKRLLNNINGHFRTQELSEALKLSISDLLEFSQNVASDLWLVDKQSNKINYLFTARTAELSIVIGKESIINGSLELGRGIAGKVWEKKDIEIINLEAFPELENINKEIIEKYNLKSVVGYPIISNSEVIGVIISLNNEAFQPLNFNHFAIIEAVAVLGNEITRKKTEEENSRILETAADIICVASFDGYFLKINKAATQILGYSEEELLSKPYEQFIHPEDRFQTNGARVEISNGKAISYFENRYITKTGEVVWLAWSTVPLLNESLHYAVAKNITKQKQAENTLKESLQSLSDYKDALEQSFNMVLTDPDGFIIDVNKATESLSGYTREELIGTHTRVNRSGLHPQSFYAKMWDTINSGNIWRGEIHNKRKDGSFYWVDTIIVPLKNTEGNIINFLAIRSDITARKENEENLIKLNKDLAKKAHELKLSNTELEQFAVVASRDLQEPLRMVTSFLSQLKKRYGLTLDEKANEYIDFASAGARNMRDVILDLLEFSKVGNENEIATHFNPSELIEEVKLIDKKVISETNAIIRIEKLPEIFAYRSSTTKIIQHLIDNAIKFRKPNLPPIIDISAITFEDKWVFAINDNGIGIDQEFYEKIFIIFQKLHPKDVYPGSGMGLAIVKKMVESMGGEIWLDSKPDIGTTFYFSIPKTL